MREVTVSRGGRGLNCVAWSPRPEAKRSGTFALTLPELSAADDRNANTDDLRMADIKRPTTSAANRAHDYTRRLQHSVAYLVRKRDAQVGLNLRPLLQEFVYNLLSVFSLPLVLMFHGRIGAYNRQYLGLNQPVFWAQLFHVALFVVVNALFVIYYGDPDWQISIFELVLLDVLNVLRCATIAVKYATYTAAEWREMDARVLSPEERNEKLVLAGWRAPSLHLLFLEMERAITRTCPHLAKHSIVFPDVATRDAVLYQLVECLPSFNEMELCGHALSRGAEKHEHAKCSICTSAKCTDIDPVQVFLTHVSPACLATQEVHLTAGSGDRAHDVASSPQDTTARARPHASTARASTLSLRDGQHATGRRSSQATDAAPQRVLEAVDSPTPGVQTYMKAHIPSPGLPALPAKLLLWHLIFQSHFKFSSVPYFKAMPLIVFVYVALPFVIRAIDGAFGQMSAVSLLTLAIMAEENAFNLATTLSFTIVGILDHSRRLSAGLHLLQLLDSNALIALRMHDAVDEDDVDDSEMALTQQVKEQDPLLPRTASGEPAAQKTGASARTSPDVGASSSGRGLPTDSHSDHTSVSVGSAAQRPSRTQLNAPSATEITAPAGIRHRHATDRLSTYAQSLRVVQTRAKDEFSHMDLHPEADDESFSPVLTRVLERKDSIATPHDVTVTASVARYKSPSAVVPYDEARAPSDGGDGALRGRSSIYVHAVPMTPASPAVPGVLNDSANPLSGSPSPGALDSTLPMTAMLPAGSDTACSCGDPSCPTCARQKQQMQRRLPAVSRRVRSSIIARHMLLHADEIEQLILRPSALHVSLPILYPQNILAWHHLRNAVFDLGRSYAFRVMIFTGFFAVFVVAVVVFLFFLMSQRWARSTEILVVISMAGYGQLVYGLLLTFQVVQGARTNRMNWGHQRRLNKVEGLTYEYLATAHRALPSVVRDRLLQTKKVAAAVVEAINIESQLAPARVMFLPATFGLLGTLGSITLSGVLAMYQSFRAMST